MSFERVPARRNAFGGIVTLLIIATAICAGTASANGLGKCTPPGQPVGPQQIQVAKRGSLEVTEYGSAGSYRKTICDSKSRVVKSVESAPFPFAHGIVRYLPLAITTRVSGKADAYTTKTIEYASPLARGWNHAFRKKSAAAFGQVLPAANPLRLRTPTAAALTASLRAVHQDAVRPLAKKATGNACTDNTFALYTPDVFPSRAVPYYTASASFPAGAATARSIRNAAYTWNNTVNDCGLSDQSNVVGSRMGDTDERVHSVDDGINVIDFGDPQEVGCGGAITLACTFIFFDHGVRTGFDIRFNNAQRWVNGAKASGFDVQSVATHELGHGLIGLNDVTGAEHSELTMYANGTPGDIRGRGLALGDVSGLRTQYPEGVDLSAGH